jgi:hypothetical protein
MLLEASSAGPAKGSVGESPGVKMSGEKAKFEGLYCRAPPMSNMSLVGRITKFA